MTPDVYFEGCFALGIMLLAFGCHCVMCFDESDSSIYSSENITFSSVSVSFAFVR